MKELTKAEEQVMRLLWKRGNAFVRELLEDFDAPRPAYNTVSTIVRILEQKGFVAHEVFGNSHRYHPLISKEEYRKFSTGRMVRGYFDGSPRKFLSFFLREADLDVDDLDEMLEMIEKAKEEKSKNKGNHE